MTNQNPQPFIFEAADVNADLAVNVLDVVGTVNIIRNPKGASAMSINSTATYTIEDGILYVDSDVALGGVQFRIEAGEDAAISALEALSAFELVKDYDCTIHYHLSKENVAADALSRKVRGDLSSLSTEQDQLAKEFAKLKIEVVRHQVVRSQFWHHWWYNPL